MMAHSPDGKRASPAASRPPYLKLPSLSMSMSAWTWRTCNGLLILSSAPSPAMPFAFVARGRS